MLTTETYFFFRRFGSIWLARKQRRNDRNERERELTEGEGGFIYLFLFR